jgi:hypothetical protein
MGYESAAGLAKEAILAKAERWVGGSRGVVAERQRQSNALRRIAGMLAGGIAGLRSGLPPAIADGSVSAPDLERAAEEVYSLALRREAQGKQSRLDAPMRAGWEMGGHDTPIHRPTLVFANELYEIAIALHGEEFWRYSQCLLLESLHEYEAAANAFESLTGTYAKHAKSQAERCRRKMAGSYRAVDEQQAAFQDVIDRFAKAGVDTSFVAYARDAYMSAMQDLRVSAASQPSAPDLQQDPDENARLDRAAQAAQFFAEHLVDQDFDSARTMLSRELPLSVADLREAYEGMTYGHGADDSVRVVVMSSQSDMPNMGVGDLAWVYVAISGDQFNEAISVVVCDEGGIARIRELEWGRP